MSPVYPPGAGLYPGLDGFLGSLFFSGNINGEPSLITTIFPEVFLEFEPIPPTVRNPPTVPSSTPPPFHLSGGLCSRKGASLDGVQTVLILLGYVVGPGEEGLGAGPGPGAPSPQPGMEPTSGTAPSAKRSSACAGPAGGASCVEATPCGAGAGGAGGACPKGAATTRRVAGRSGAATGARPGRSSTGSAVLRWGTSRGRGSGSGPTRTRGAARQGPRRGAAFPATCGSTGTRT